MMTKKNKIIFTIICVLIIGSFGSLVTFVIHQMGGPEQAFGTFKDLFVLRSGISKEIDANNIHINVNNNSFMNIAVINSKYNEESKETRKDVSKTVFDYVSQNYTDMGNIEVVNIVFVKSKSIGTFHTNRSLGAYGFIRNNEDQWEEREFHR